MTHRHLARFLPVLLLIAAVILSGVWLAQSGGRRPTANPESSK